MDFPQLYAIAAGGVFVILIIIKHFPSIKRLIRLLILLASEHLTYPLVLRRYRFLGPWSRADVLIQLAYLAINIFLITFGITSFKDAWTRAGTVSVVNLMPLFFGFHLSFLADLLGVSLSTYRRIHRSVGSMSFLVGLFHVLAAVQSNSSYSLDASKNLYGLIVSHNAFCPREPAAYNLAGSIFSGSAHVALLSVSTQTLVRVLPSYSSSTGIPMRIRSLAALKLEALASPSLYLYLYRNLLLYLRPATLQHSVS
jgi:hypothetical protein